MENYIKNTKKKIFMLQKKPIKTGMLMSIMQSSQNQLKPNSKYLIGYLDKAKRSLVLIMPKMCKYIKTFKVEDGGKDKINKLMSFRIDDKKYQKNKKILVLKLKI